MRPSLSSFAAHLEMAPLLTPINSARSLARLTPLRMLSNRMSVDSYQPQVRVSGGGVQGPDLGAGLGLHGVAAFAELPVL